MYIQNVFTKTLGPENNFILQINVMSPDLGGGYLFVCGLFVVVCFCFVLFLFFFVFFVVFFCFDLFLLYFVFLSSMVRENRVQSQVESYQRLFKKWYLIPPCLILSIISYVSRVKWSNPGKGVAPSSTPQCSSYWKGSFLVAPDYSHQLLKLFQNYFYNIQIDVCITTVLGSPM